MTTASMNKSTLTAIINAFNVASKDQTRWAMNHVCIEKTHSGNVSIVSVDGHHLVKNTRHDPDLFSALDDKQWFISRDVLPMLKAVQKSWGKLMTIPLEVVSEGLIHFTAPGMTVAMTHGKDFAFPDYRQVLPKEENYTVSVGVNPEYIMNLFKAMTDGSRCYGVRIRINPNDKMAPLIIEHNGQMGIVMPMRL